MAKKPNKPESLQQLAKEMQSLMQMMSPEDLEVLKNNMGQILDVQKSWDNEDEEKLDVAQALIFDAWEENRADKRIALAKEAIAESDCCADAYLVLADDFATSANERMLYVREAVSAGERAMKVLKLDDQEGHYWGLIETRPYMRALSALGRELQQAGKMDEAIAIFERMIVLNPNDNQGMRYILLEHYLRRMDRKKTQALLTQYEEDASAFFAFNKALYAFLLNGKSEEAKALLGDAMQANPHVAKYLTEKKKLPKRLPESYQFGRDDEAQLYAAEAKKTWSSIPDALTWLKEEYFGKPLL